MEIKRVKDYMTVRTVGFFKRMEAIAPEEAPAPWLPYIASETIDKLYYLESKDRLVSDWWEDLEGDTEAGKDEMAGLLWDIYKTKWSHLFEIYEATYNPLENYDRMEDVTETTKRTGTEETEHTGTDTTERTPDITTTVEHSGTDTEKRTPDITRTNKTKSNIADSTDKRAAFNSTSLLDTGGTHSTQTDEREEKETGTDTTSLTKQTTETQTEEGVESSTLTRDTADTLTRDTTDTMTRKGRIHGNIGVTTAAQMMTEDKEAWTRLQLIEGMLMDDLNEQLTLAIFI